MTTEKVFSLHDMQVYTGPKLDFDKQGFIDRLILFTNLNLILNYHVVDAFDQPTCKLVYNLSFSAFSKVSFHYRFKDAVTTNIPNKDLYDSYERLLEVGTNQYLTKLIELKKSKRIEFDTDHKDVRDADAEYLQAQAIVMDGAKDLADDIEELFKNYSHVG